MAPIALLGGTFNPIHIGHLRGAIELREMLGFARVVLVPAAMPPLKEAPDVGAVQRADMVELALAGVPGLEIDRRELERSGPSYTVDTLQAWRSEIGPDCSLTFILGMDSLAQLDRWHRWQQLTELANVAVMTRPGCDLPDNAAVTAWFRRHQCDPKELRRRAFGGVARVEQTPLAVSSTAIRAARRQGKDARFLLPDAVMEYILTHDLYRS